jgi:hypothetical protein
MFWSAPDTAEWPNFSAFCELIRGTVELELSRSESLASENVGKYRCLPAVPSRRAWRKIAVFCGKTRELTTISFDLNASVGQFINAKRDLGVTVACPVS